VLSSGERAGLVGPRQQVGERVERRSGARQPGVEVHQRRVDLLGDLQTEVLAELAGCASRQVPLACGRVGVGRPFGDDQSYRRQRVEQRLQRVRRDPGVVR